VARQRALHAACLAGLLLVACGGTPRPPRATDDSVRLKVPAEPVSGVSARRTIYVPVYSSIYHGLRIRSDQVELSATVSIRNVSTRFPLVLTSVRYYDSHGQRLRSYLEEPRTLDPLASVEYVIDRADNAGGPGASFLVQWTGPAEIDEPLVEAVMIGQAANAGISFTSRGRTVSQPPAEQ
jgi:hypothetical protein